MTFIRLAEKGARVVARVNPLLREFSLNYLSEFLVEEARLTALQKGFDRGSDRPPLKSVRARRTDFGDFPIGHFVAQF